MRSYRTLVEHAVDGMFRTTPAGRFLLANHALARMLGYDSPEQLIAERTDLAHHHYVWPDDRTRFCRLLEANGVVRGFEYEAYHRDGTRVWLRDHARVVHDPDGTTYYEETVEDISERRRGEEVLERHRPHGDQRRRPGFDVTAALQQLGGGRADIVSRPATQIQGPTRPSAAVEPPQA